MLDKEFSLYIRLKYSDENGYCRCITCGTVRKWNDIDNGHFITRDKKATRFDERNCRPQCKFCNNHKKGEQYKFAIALIEIYGREEIEDLERLASIGGGYCAIQLAELIKEYRIKVKELKKEKGL